MPGVVQHTLESMTKAAVEAVEAGVGGLMLYGIPPVKDARGSGGDDPAGILNVALGRLRDELGDRTVLMADLCLDEFTDHGHCGVLDADGEVDNDATLLRYAEMALAQAAAGADLLGTSGMMDGQVGAVRAALDAGGYRDTGILAYAAKFASGFYGPFREAVDSSLIGDRKSYQQDHSRAVAEALAEVALDVAEGADAVMVKPALPYLDVLRAVADVSPVPVAAYQVSGEYAMVEAAAANGWLERDRVIAETLNLDQAGGGLDDPDLLGRRGGASRGRAAHTAPMTADASTRPQALSSDAVAFAGYVVAAVLIVVVTVLLTQIALRRRNGRPIYRAPDPPDNRPVGTARFDPGPADPPHPAHAPGRPRRTVAADRRRDRGRGHRLAAAAPRRRCRRSGSPSPPISPGWPRSRRRATRAWPAPVWARCRARRCARATEPSAVLLVAGRPAVAYIRIDEVDGIAHVDQLAVLPAVARRGIGKALLDAAVEWAAERGYPAMTLSTFAESDWNQRVYDADRLRPDRAADARACANCATGSGPSAWTRSAPRVVMRRELSA